MELEIRVKGAGSAEDLGGWMDMSMPRRFSDQNRTRMRSLNLSHVLPVFDRITLNLKVSHQLFHNVKTLGKTFTEASCQGSRKHRKAK